MKKINQIIFGIFLISLVTSCNDKDILEPKDAGLEPLTIGQSYQGGTIFYLDATGQHGLIAAPNDDFNNISTGGTTSSFTFQVTGISGNVGTQLQKVNFSITNADVYDLTVILQAPNGSTVQLVYSYTTHGANFSNTTIQTGYPSMSGYTPPYNGTFGPDQPFSNLSASTASGVWKLLVKNDSPTNYGELTNATVYFNSLSFPITIPKSKKWDTGSSTNTGATGSSIGTGSSNTSSITGFYGNGIYGAKACEDMVTGGYSDWHLPSIDELTELYNQRTVISGLNLTVYYWSSTEITSTTAYRKGFSSGTNSSNTKGSLGYVRAIRKF